MAPISSLILVISLIPFVTGATQYGGSTEELRRMSTSVNAQSTTVNRKLLAISQGEGEVSAAPQVTAHPTRMWGDKCSKSDIAINQGATSPLPSGIPTYTVEIMNVCRSGCDISGIHVSCGWFSSARLVNPHHFKRLGYDNCLVNDGKPLLNGRAISFQYANTFSYPMSVTSVIC